MRLINADAFKEQVSAITIKGNHPTKKANAMMKLIDMQPTVLDIALLEEAAEEIENLYGRETDLSRKIRDSLN